jgi:transcriptional regulator with XRE-family HTH domain
MTAVALPVGAGDPSFPELLRFHRLRAGLTQRALADLSTVSPRAIRDLESGRANARTQTIHLLADGLRLQGPLRDLFVRASLSRRGVSPFPVSPPDRLDPILGRAAEAQALADILTPGRRRVVTLSGLPGVGKSRLAVEIAARLAAAGDRPAIWASDADAPELGRRLGGSAVLVVLDGVAAPRPASAVAELLACCPGVRVLATSRIPWRLPGVQAAVVGPLAVPPASALTAAVPQVLSALTSCGQVGALRLPAAAVDLASYPSVRLLVERLTDVRPGLALSAAEVEAAARLCRRVDGLPLAIEAVARRGRVLSLRQLSELPDADLLDLGLPGAPAFSGLTGRPGTLGAVLAGALDGLGSAHLALLRDLAQPDRVWTVPEAATLLARPLQRTIDGLDTLIGHGLVQASQGAREITLHVPNLVRAVLGRAAGERVAPAA